MFTTAVAITIALTLANIINPGMGIDTAVQPVMHRHHPHLKMYYGIFPTNTIKAMSDGKYAANYCLRYSGGRRHHAGSGTAGQVYSALAFQTF